MSRIPSAKDWLPYDLQSTLYFVSDTSSAKRVSPMAVICGNCAVPDQQWKYNVAQNATAVVSAQIVPVRHNLIARRFRLSSFIHYFQEQLK